MLTIKMSGSGTREQILASLKALTESLSSVSNDELMEGKVFEDETLCTEVSESN